VDAEKDIKLLESQFCYLNSDSPIRDLFHTLNRFKTDVLAQLASGDKMLYLELNAYQVPPNKSGRMHSLPKQEGSSDND